MTAPATAERRRFFEESCIKGDGKRKIALAKAAERHSAELRTQRLREAAAARAQKAAAAAAQLQRTGQRTFADTLDRVFPGPAGGRDAPAMSDIQLQRECRALQLMSSSNIGRASRAELLQTLAQHDRTLTLWNSPGELQNKFVETADTNTMIRGPEGAEITICPTRGPVQIEALVNGMPTKCFLSTASTITAISRSFAQSVGCAFEPIDANRGAFVAGNAPSTIQAECER